MIKMLRIALITTCMLVVGMVGAKEMSMKVFADEIQNEQENLVELDTWEEIEIEIVMGHGKTSSVDENNNGVMIKKYKDSKSNKEFDQSRRVKVIRDRGRDYMIYDEGKVYYIPQSNVMITHTNTSQYTANKDNVITTNDLKTKIRDIKKDELVKLIEVGSDEKFSKYKTSEGIEGYTKNEDYDVVIEQVLNFGLAKVDVEVIEGNEEYKISQGDQVGLEDFKEGKYIIKDNRGKEFKVKEEYIQLQPRGSSKASRGGAVGRTIPPVKIDPRVEKVETLIKAAESKMGATYVWGATGPNSYDCSGFTLMAYKSVGVTLNRVSQDQANNGVHVERGNLQRGDLVFFKTTPRNIGHVGIYLGNNKFIHASSGGGKVMVSGLTESYYSSRYVTARRIL